MADVYLIATSGSVNWGTGANWSSGSAPAAGDRVFITQGTAKIDSGLTPTLTGANKLAGLYIYDGFSGEIGTTALYGGYLTLGATEFVFNQPANASRFTSTGTSRGSQWAKIDLGADITSGVVFGTGEPKNGGSGYEALLLGVNNSSSVIEVRDGVVGLSNNNGATGAIGQLNVFAGQVNAYQGVTVANADQDGGELSILKAVMTLFKQQGGIAKFWGDGKVTTSYVGGQTYFANRKSAAASFDTIYALNGGVVDFTLNPAAFTITNPILARKGSKILLSAGNQATLVSTDPLAIRCDGCQPADIIVDANRVNVQLEITAF